MIKKLKLIFFGIILIATGAILFWLKLTDPERLYNNMPDHDYISEIKTLIGKKHWLEAERLCEDVISAELPSAPEAEKLLQDCRRQTASIPNRVGKVWSGFVTGSHDNSVEELGGCIVSDLLLYGDIRDLVLQGYYKLSGREFDPVITVLAAAGLITEIADIADWFPAFLKAVRKSDSMRPELAVKLADMIRNSLKEKKFPGKFVKFFRETGSLIKLCGTARAVNMFKNVRSPSDLSMLVKFCRKSPALASLTVKHCGLRSYEVFETAAKSSSDMLLLKNIARKGKFITRSGKIVYKHKFELLRPLFQGKVFFPLCLLFWGGGVIFLYLGCRKKRLT